MSDAIPCPTDGSAGSDAAIQQARGLAALTGARIHALFVVKEGVAGADEWDLVVTSGALS